MDYTKRDHGCVSVHTAVSLCWRHLKPDQPTQNTCETKAIAQMRLWMKNCHKGKQLAPQAVLLPYPLYPQDLVGDPGLDDGRGANSFLHQYGTVLHKFKTILRTSWNHSYTISFLHKFRTILRTSCNALHSIEKEVRSPLCRDPPSAMVVVVVVLVAVAVFVVVGRWLLVVVDCSLPLWFSIQWN